MQNAAPSPQAHGIKGGEFSFHCIPPVSPNPEGKKVSPVVD